MGSVKVTLGKNVEEKAVEGVVKEGVEYTIGKVTGVVVSSQASGVEEVAASVKDVIGEGVLSIAQDMAMEEAVGEDATLVEELPVEEASVSEKVPVEEPGYTSDAVENEASAEEPSVEVDEEAQDEEPSEGDAEEGQQGEPAVVQDQEVQEVTSSEETTPLPPRRKTKRTRISPSLEEALRKTIREHREKKKEKPYETDEDDEAPESEEDW